MKMKVLALVLMVMLLLAIAVPAFAARGGGAYPANEASCVAQNAYYVHGPTAQNARFCD